MSALSTVDDLVMPTVVTSKESTVDDRMAQWAEVATVGMSVTSTVDEIRMSTVDIQSKSTVDTSVLNDAGGKVTTADRLQAATVVNPNVEWH